jgi:hypothetical protein
MKALGPDWFRAKTCPAKVRTDPKIGARLVQNQNVGAPNFLGRTVVFTLPTFWLTWPGSLFPPLTIAAQPPPLAGRRAASLLPSRSATSPGAPHHLFSSSQQQSTGLPPLIPIADQRALPQVQMG